MYNSFRRVVLVKSFPPSEAIPQGAFIYIEKKKNLPISNGTRSRQRLVQMTMMKVSREGRRATWLEYLDATKFTVCRP